MKWADWIMLLKSPESADRSAAADISPEDAIDEDVIKALLPRLTDEDALVRACAADTISHYPLAEVAQALADRLRHERDEVARSYLVRGLGYMRDAAYLPTIMSIFQADEPLKVKISAAHAILELQLEPAIRQITDATKGTDDRLQINAFSTMRVAAEILLEQLAHIKSIAEESRERDIPRIAQDSITEILNMLPDIKLEEGNQ